MKSKASRFGSAGFFILGALAALALTFSTNQLAAVSAEEAKPVTPAVDDQTIALAEGLSRAFEQVASAVSPAVVHISSSRTVNMPGSRSPFGSDPFEEFFGRRLPRSNRPQRQFKQNALGSGVIVSADGYILTNNHVVSDADALKVTLSDKREFDGKIVGTDPDSEVAVIKIDGKNLPFAQIGDSDKLNVGSWVVAIGNPFGFDRTVTVGVVSATGRSLGMQAYEDFIQTDAAINPGNSGGPLVNLRGEVVGINTAIVSRSGGYQGLGFAIPSKMAKSVMDDLINEGRVVRGFLGVQPQDIDDELAGTLELDSREGALVTEVVPGAAAEKAGVQNGDIILKFGGKKIVDSKTLRNVVAATPVGKEIEIIISRKGKTITLKGKVGDRSEHIASAGGRSTTAKGDFGITVQANTPALREQLGIEEADGVIVAEVAPGSKADEKDIRAGSLILEVNQKPVNSVAEFQAEMAKADAKKGLLLLVRERGVNRFVPLKEE